MKQQIFIAEIKLQSPFGFKSDKSFFQLAELAVMYGDWISVHTNPLWGGSYEQIEFIRALTDKPILAKGFHSRIKDIDKAESYGADYILCVRDTKLYGGVNIRKCLFEAPYTLAKEQGKGVEGTARCIGTLKLGESLKYVSNNRDLKTGQVKANSDLQQYIDDPDMKWVCQASGIVTPKDVHPNADAFIVGEHLEKFCATKELNDWQKAI